MTSLYLNLTLRAVASCIVFAFYYYSAVAPERRFKTFWPRFWAICALDALVMVLMILGLDRLPIPRPVGYPKFFAHIQFFVYFLYRFVMHAACGQTFGKMICRLKVVDAGTLGPIKLHQALLREFIPMLIAVCPFLALLHINGAALIWLRGLIPVFLCLWFLIDVIAFFVDDRWRALHDTIAGTVVIRTDVTESGEPPFAAVPAINPPPAN